jgi:hypothetical protein
LLLSEKARENHSEAVVFLLHQETLNFVHLGRYVKQLQMTESCASSIFTLLARQWNDLLYVHCVTLQEMRGVCPSSSLPNSISVGITEAATNVFSFVYVSQYVSCDVLLTSIILAPHICSALYTQSVAWHFNDFISFFLSFKAVAHTFFRRIGCASQRTHLNALKQTIIILAVVLT